MPQMSPMLWSILFIYFIFLFMIFNILNYFNFFISSNLPNNSETPLSYNKISFNWKW